METVDSLALELGSWLGKETEGEREDLLVLASDPWLATVKVREWVADWDSQMEHW